MKKFILGILLIAVFGVLAACGSVEVPNQGAGQNQTPQNQQGGTQPPGGTTQTPPPGSGPDSINWNEHETFTWFMLGTPPNDYFTDYAEEPIANYLMNRFNVTFEFQQPISGTESDALALMMGSGRYTDAINLAVYQGSVSQLHDDGIIIDIAEWLDYMPNFRRWLETDPDFNRIARDDQGRILCLPNIADEPVNTYSGLVYRHDILETMTGGNVQFPSGNNVPTTIADWEYMLPLFLEYFRGAGFADYAPLILPSNGVIHFGELMNSFGSYYHFYVRNDTVYSGILQPQFYNYVETMRRWYENGWIHQDFASRTGEMFFRPNPPLVFGGAAGAWYGMGIHLGDQMSMPEFGMNFDVRPAPSPMAEGVTHRDMLRRGEDLYGSSRGNAISTSNHNIGKFLAVIDHLYSEEGGMLRGVGLSADQVTDDSVMHRMGMSEGAHWFDDAGNVVFHPNIDTAGGHIIISALVGVRFNGFAFKSFENSMREERVAHADAMWTAQDSVTEVHPLPGQLSPTSEEAAILATNEPRINDIRDQRLVRFIIGSDPLTPDTWAAFLDELRALGIEENLAIHQAAYDRFLVRGQ